MNKIKKLMCCCFTCVEIHQTNNNDENADVSTPLLKNCDFSYTNKYFSPNKNLKTQKQQKINNNIKRRRRLFSYYKKKVY